MCRGLHWLAACLAHNSHLRALGGKKYPGLISEDSSFPSPHWISRSYDQQVLRAWGNCCNARPVLVSLNAKQTAAWQKEEKSWDENCCFLCMKLAFLQRQGWLLLYRLQRMTARDIMAQEAVHGAAMATPDETTTAVPLSLVSWGNVFFFFPFKSFCLQAFKSPLFI